MDASRRLAQQRCRLAHVFQPADALLVLDRNPRRIELLLERSRTLEFLPRPELDAARPKGSPSVVTSRLECIKSPHTVCILKRPALSLPLLIR
jgi:hypothetical protein